MNKFHSKHLFVLIVMCGITSSVLGVLINVGGLFFTPIAEELGALRGSVSMTLTITNLCFAVGGLFTARYINSHTFKRLVLAATLVLAGSTALMSLCRHLRRGPLSDPWKHYQPCRLARRVSC